MTSSSVYEHESTLRIQPIQPIQTRVHPSTGRHPPTRDFSPPRGDRGIIFRLSYKADARPVNTRGKPVTMEVVAQKRILFLCEYCTAQRSVPLYPSMQQDGKMYWYGKMTGQDPLALADLKKTAYRSYMHVEVMEGITDERFRQIMDAAFTYQAYQFKLNDAGILPEEMRREGSRGGPREGQERKEAIVR